MKMSDLKFTMLGNILFDIVYTICVTFAAIHFERPTLLWWYFLLAFTGYNYKRD